MKSSIKFSIYLLLVYLIVFPSCRKDKTEGNQEELITTLQLTFKRTSIGGPNIPFTFEYDDPDGPGGAAPIIDDIVLPFAADYEVTMTLLNKTSTPITNLTGEIRAEGDAHRFYFKSSPGLYLFYGDSDKDSLGVPLGLVSSWTSGSASSGTVKVTLRHYPGNPPNKSEYDEVNSPKSTTDLEVVFNVRIP